MLAVEVALLSLDACGIAEQGYRNRSQRKNSEGGVITTIPGKRS